MNSNVTELVADPHIAMPTLRASVNASVSLEEVQGLRRGSNGDTRQRGDLAEKFRHSWRSHKREEAIGFAEAKLRRFKKFLRALLLHRTIVRIRWARRGRA